VALLEAEPPGPELVAAYTAAASALALGGRTQEGLAWADRALTLASDLGLPASARALGVRGVARLNAGEAGGLVDLRNALTLARDQGLGRETALLFNNLGLGLWPFEGPGDALAVLRDGRAFCERRGIAEIEHFI